MFRSVFSAQDKLWKRESSHVNVCYVGFAVPLDAYQVADGNHAANKFYKNKFSEFAAHVCLIFHFEPNVIRHHQIIISVVCQHLRTYLYSAKIRNHILWQTVSDNLVFSTKMVVDICFIINYIIESVQNHLEFSKIICN